MFTALPHKEVVTILLQEISENCSFPLYVTEPNSLKEVVESEELKNSMIE